MCVSPRDGCNQAITLTRQSDRICLECSGWFGASYQAHLTRQSNRFITETGVPLWGGDCFGTPPDLALLAGIHIWCGSPLIFERAG